MSGNFERWKNHKHQWTAKGKTDDEIIKHGLETARIFESQSLADRLNLVWSKLAFPNQPPLTENDHFIILEAIQKLKIYRKSRATAPTRRTGEGEGLTKDLAQVRLLIRIVILTEAWPFASDDILNQIFEAWNQIDFPIVTPPPKQETTA